MVGRATGGRRVKSAGYRPVAEITGTNSSALGCRQFPRYHAGVASPQVPAARNTLQILSLLSAIDVPVSAARIRTELDLPRSTTYHLLGELTAAGYVVHIPENQTYGLGLAAYSMAQAYSRQQPLVRLATKPLKQAADLIGGSGHLSRMAGSEIVYLHEVRAPGALSLITDVGVRLQAARTASGRIMLAHLPETEARAAFSASESAGTLREFQDLLRVSRGRGFGEETEEVSRGQCSVAVVIEDHLRRPAAALAVTFPTARGDASTRTELVKLLKRHAAQISRTMYGEPA